MWFKDESQADIRNPLCYLLDSVKFCVDFLERIVYIVKKQFSTANR